MFIFIYQSLFLWSDVEPYILVDVMYFTSGNADQSVHVVAGEGLEAYLPLADMIDITAEIQRLYKRLSKMQTEYDGLKARLSSPKVWILFTNV